MHFNRPHPFKHYTYSIIILVFIICVQILSYLQPVINTDTVSADTVKPTANTSTLAAYYQTNGGHPAAMHHVINLFKRYYPTRNIHIHNDGGNSNMRAIARLHGITNYSYTVFKGSSSRYGMYFSDVKSATSYLNRLAKTAEAADWLLLLEDDVWLHGPIETDNLLYDINSQCVHPLNEALVKVINPHGHANVCYHGGGGSIIRSSGLLASNYSEERVSELLYAYGNTSIASDELLSAIILMNGGTIGPYKGFTEFSYKPGIRVQHQAKSLY